MHVGGQGRRPRLKLQTRMQLVETGRPKSFRRRGAKARADFSEVPRLLRGQKRQNVMKVVGR
jgi:hypothetical protein